MLKNILSRNRKLTAWLLVAVMLIQLLHPLSLQASAKSSSFISSGMVEFKNSFAGVGSPAWILEKFGIEFGYHLIESAMKGEKPDLIKVAKSMATADYLAQTAGSVLGTAAGSFFIPVVSSVPIFGGFLTQFIPALGYFFGSKLAGSGLAGIKNGGFSFKDFFKKLDWTAMIAGTIGWTAGSLLCSAIFPPIGGIVGGMLGDIIAGKLLEKFRKWRNDSAPPTTTRGGPIIRPEAVAQANYFPTGRNSSETLIEGSIAVSNKEKIMEITQKYEALYLKYQQKFLSAKKEELKAISQEMNRLKLQLELLRKVR